MSWLFDENWCTFHVSFEVFFREGTRLVAIKDRVGTDALIRRVEQRSTAES
jgi:hypothetical protein